MGKKDVFINCPFDNEFRSLLRVLIFTIIFIGYVPKLTLEKSDSSQTRISKITELISASELGIHDLSRIKATKKGEFFRLNMPFELGMDFGNKCYSADNKEKKILILCSEKYDYQKALSDLAGCDIKSHNNVETQLVKVLREWFHETVGVEDITGPTGIWYKYTDFLSELDTSFIRKGFSEKDLLELPISEYIKFVKKWVEDN